MGGGVSKAQSAKSPNADSMASEGLGFRGCGDV